MVIANIEMTHTNTHAHAYTHAHIYILYHFIAHANPYCKLLYSGEDFISWKNLCPIPICYI